MKKTILFITIILGTIAISLDADLINLTPTDDMYTDVEHTTLPPTITELWVAEFAPAGHFERIMIKFDLAELEDQIINSAILHLNRFMGCPMGGTTNVNFYAISEDWDETSWDPHTHAQYNSYIWSSYGFNYDGWHEIDVTELVQNWNEKTIANYGLLMRAETGSKWSKFYSKDHSEEYLHPYLEIDYTPVNADENTIAAEKFKLNNYPNPFNPSTTISFSITTESTENTEKVGIEIFNVKGQKIRTLECIGCDNAASSQMMNSIVWHGRDDDNKPVSSGVYFYQLQIDGQPAASRKMMLLK